MVNIRRGIVAPPVLIEINGVSELRGIKADAHTLEIGAAVTLSDLAAHPEMARHYPVVAQAAAHIAGPTHRNMGTVGGNLCPRHPLHLLQSERMVARRRTITASRPPAKSATSRRRAAASASPLSAATSRRRC